MSSHDVFSVDAIGLVRPPVRLLTAVLSICLFFCCSSTSSDQILISCSGTLFCDDCEEMVSASVASSESICSTAPVTSAKGVDDEAMDVLILA